MQELIKGDIRAIKSTGDVGIITKVEKEKTVYYYHLAHAAGEALGEHIFLGRFKLEELDYTDEQKEEMWHEHEENSQRANEDNHYHYYNR